MTTTIGIIGSGAMGSGIAQVAAVAGCHVLVFDTNAAALERARTLVSGNLAKLQEKGKIQSSSAVLERMAYVETLDAFAPCSLVIEAVVERLDVKQQIFTSLEKIVTSNCILASNTSSLSITSIAASCSIPSRVLGLHFFNPAPIMALVEVIPAIQTNPELPAYARGLMEQWGKTPVIAKDTPGFIVNRVARPFYGEALRIYDEGLAGLAEIDFALTSVGGFRMGPFALMDYIGHDVNYVVTETVFQSFYFDPRYKPSLTQKRLLEAGWLGRKSGRGFYNYGNGEVPAIPAAVDAAATQSIFERILAMLINEAVDALYLGIASSSDLETAMTKGVNYPKGLLSWCDEWGAANCLAILDNLYEHYHEDRYRASPLLRKKAARNEKFV